MAWVPSCVANVGKTSKHRRIHVMRPVHEKQTGQPWDKPGHDGGESQFGGRTKGTKRTSITMRPLVSLGPVFSTTVRYCTLSGGPSGITSRPPILSWSM